MFDLTYRASLGVPCSKSNCESSIGIRPSRVPYSQVVSMEYLMLWREDLYVDEQKSR